MIVYDPTNLEPCLDNANILDVIDRIQFMVRVKQTMSRQKSDKFQPLVLDEIPRGVTT